MATIKRTTTTIKTPPRTLPVLPQGGLGSRAPEIEQPIYDPQDEPDYSEEPAESEVVTVGAEQLERSQEIEAMGVEAWKAAHDERDPDQQPRSVAGVGYAPTPGETDDRFRSR